MSIINGEILEPDLKFVQLKSFQLSGSNENGGSGQCLAYHYQRQQLYACCRNELLCLPFNSLLNFDTWTKEQLKTIDSNVVGKSIITIESNSVDSHLISLSSKGYGSKLALCCYDHSQQSLFVNFYDLNVLSQNQEKSMAYSKFNIPIKSQQEVRVRMFQWHPEFSDNIFALSLTNGSFYVAYVSDSDRNVLTVLTHLDSPRRITSFAWSPRGKQIVLAFADNTISHFSQFKLTINEKDLVQNTPFDEAKKIILPGEDLKNYQVQNICWLSTFNFIVVAFNSSINDTRYMLVCIPSAKATGDDAIIKVVDFSSINIDMNDNNPLEVNFVHMQNILFTYTNRSNNFALLGCPTVSDISNYSKWGEITLEDVSCLMLPNVAAEVRGLTFVPGTSKQFAFSSSVFKGGPSRHFALTYDSIGHLTLFMCDFEQPESANFVHMNTPPATVIKPIVSSVALNQASQPNQFEKTQTMQPGTSLVLNKLTHSSSSIVTTASPHQPINFSLQTQTATSEPKLAFGNNNVANISSITSLASNSIMPNTQPVASVSKPQPSSVIQKVQPNSQTVSVSSKSDAESNLSQLCMEEIRINISEFEKELKSIVASQKATLASCTIGSHEQFEKLKYEFDFIARILDDLVEHFNSINVDINQLQSSFIELHYLYEEARSLVERHNDPKYYNLLRERKLDPVTAKKVKIINLLKDYIDVQLRELEQKFELEWKEWLQKKRKTKTASGLMSTNKFISPPTSPHTSFISSQTDDENELENFEKLTNKTIYKAIANNQRLIDNLKMQIDDAIKNVSTIRKNYSQDSKHLDSVHDLSKMFNNSLKLNPNRSILSNKTQQIQLNSLDSKRKSSLKRFLENRHSVPIRVCGPTATTDGQYSHNSRFISVLEKIKQKQKTMLASDGETQPATSTITNQTLTENSVVGVPKQAVDQPSSSSTTGNLVMSNMNRPAQSSIMQHKSAISNSAPVISKNLEQPTILATPSYETISPATTPTEEREQIASLISTALSYDTNFKENIASNSILSQMLAGAELSRLTTTTKPIGSLTTGTPISNSIMLGTGTANNGPNVSNITTVSDDIQSNVTPVFTFKLPSSSTNVAMGQNKSNQSVSSSITVSDKATKTIETIKPNSSNTTQLPSFSMPSFNLSMFNTNEASQKKVEPKGTTSTEHVVGDKSLLCSAPISKLALSSSPVNMTTNLSSVLSGQANSSSTFSPSVPSDNQQQQQQQALPLTKSVTNLPKFTPSSQTLINGANTLSSVSNLTQAATTTVSSTSTVELQPSSAPSAFSGSFSFAKAFSNLLTTNAATTTVNIVTSTTSSIASATTSTSTSGFSFNQPNSNLKSSPFGSFSFGSAQAVNSTANIGANQITKTEIAFSPSTTTTGSITSTTATTVQDKTSVFTASSSATSTLPVASTETVSTTTAVTQPVPSQVKPISFSFNQAFVGNLNGSSDQPIFGQSPQPQQQQQLQQQPVKNALAISDNNESKTVPVSFSTASPFAGPPNNSIENTLNSFSICSPSADSSKPVVSSNAGNAFASFSFGGTPAASSTNSSFLFGPGPTSEANPLAGGGGSLFGGNTTTGGGSIFSSNLDNTSQTPAGSSSQNAFVSTQKVGTFGFQTNSAPASGSVFGSPAKLNGSLFGQPATFGGSPSFGSSLPFGNSPGGFSSPQATPFTNFNLNSSFASFAMKDSDVPSFDSFAAESNNNSQTSNNSFGQFNNPNFGQDASFMQRRK